jgi:hypothetical protein
MRLYVSGPMTGIPDFNFPAFARMTRTLRGMGHLVWSPAEMDEQEGVTPTLDGSVQDPRQYAGYLARDIRVIAENEIEGVVVLNGWRNSGGAKTEVAFALALGLPIFTLSVDHTGAYLYELPPMQVDFNEKVFDATAA